MCILVITLNSVAGLQICNKFSLSLNSAINLTALRILHQWCSLIVIAAVVSEFNVVAGIVSELNIIMKLILCQNNDTQCDLQTIM